MKLLNAFCKYFSILFVNTPNANNNHLTKLNGSTTLFNGSWQDMMINGSATLGTPQSKTCFEGVIVVNGSAKIMNASFKNLEMNGNVTLEKVEVNDTLHLNGNAIIKGCNIERLIIYRSRMNIDMLNSTVHSKEIKK